MLIKQTICVRHGISSTQWVRKTVKKWCRTKQSCHNTNNVRYNPTRTIMSIPCGQHKPFYQFSQKKPLTSPKKKNIVFDKPIYVLSILSDKPWSIHWVQHIMYSTIMSDKLFSHRVRRQKLNQLARQTIMFYLLCTPIRFIKPLSPRNILRSTNNFRLPIVSDKPCQANLVELKMPRWTYVANNSLAKYLRGTHFK